MGEINKRLINKLSLRLMKANKKRSFLIMVAIAITTFLLCTIFTMGSTYVSLVNKQSKQIVGTTSDLTLTKPTAMQIKMLNDSTDIEHVGCRVDIVQLDQAFIKNMEQANKLFYGFRYYDEVEWENHRVPVLENIVGNYPTKEEEIMIPSWVLKKIGVTKPEIGQKITFTYMTSQNGVMSEVREKTFNLSGWFDEYDNPMKDNTAAYLLVSKQFVENSKIEVASNNDAIIGITLKEEEKQDEVRAKLQEELNLNEMQNLILNSSLERNKMTVSFFVGVLILILIIIISGFLVIYNIFYISVINETRLYGQLKTLGATMKQIKKIVVKQVVLISVLGILLGIILSVLVAFILVPYIISTFLSGEFGVQVSFHPYVFFATIVFSLVTSISAARKPAIIAGKISSVYAIKYTGIDSVPKKKHRNVRFSLHKMAFQNVVRYKKRAVLVFLSLFLGFTVFLVISMMIHSMSVDNYVDSINDYNFTLKNRTCSLGYNDEMQQVMTKQLVENIENINGVTKVELIKQQIAKILYTNCFDQYIEYNAAKIQSEAPPKDYYINNADQFYSQLICLDTDMIRDELVDKQIDVEAYENGELGLTASDNPELFADNMVVEYQLGEKDGYSVKSSGDTYSLKIGGYISSEYNNYGVLRAGAPHIFVSSKYIDNLVEDALITHAGIKVDSTYETQVLTELKAITDQKPNIILASKIEKKEALKKTKQSLYVIGGGVAIILIFVGLLNFINIMFYSISIRKKEIKILNYIGMTQKQLYKMLIFEGGWYFVIVIGLVVSLGNIFVYALFYAFQKTVTYAQFVYPIMELNILVVLYLLMCILIPSFAYRFIRYKVSE